MVDPMAFTRKPQRPATQTPPTAAQVAGLVPAAGASRRLGRDKRRLPYRGSTLLETTVGTLRAAGLAPIVVVLEAESPCAEWGGLADCRLVINPAPERGMLSSLRCGLLALEAEAAIAAVAIQPGDHPFVSSGAVSALLAHYRRHEPALLLPRYPGRGPRPSRRGHPLLIARRLFSAAIGCDDAVGLRQLLQRFPELIEELALDEAGAEDDIDSPEDLAHLGLAPPSRSRW